MKEIKPRNIPKQVARVLKRQSGLRIDQETQTVYYEGPGRITANQLYVLLQEVLDQDLLIESMIEPEYTVTAYRLTNHWTFDSVDRIKDPEKIK